MESKTKILVVESSSFMRNLICSRLEKAGFIALATQNGEEALTHLQSDPDIQLMTINVELPGMNGFETYQHLRHDPYLSTLSRNIPVVFITSYDSLEERKRGFDLGAADFVNKAFIDTELVSTIERILQPASDMEGLHALIVDDSIFARKIVERILLSCGVIVTEADNGKAAYEMIKEDPQRFDMLITDLNMPEMGGLELTRKVRHELQLTDIPILMLSVVEDKVTQIELFRAGISDYLTKPFIKEELLGRLHAHLEVAIVNRELKEKVQELELSHRKLEQSNNERAELLHVLCHDLANPIGAIISVLDLVDANPALFDTLKDDLRKGAQHSLEVIDIVRKMRAMEEGLNFDLIEVDLRQALQESSLLLQRRLTDKNISLVIDIESDCNVMAEEVTLVNSVFNNILSNAIKFSYPNSTIHIDMEESEDWIDVNFRDTGIGMSPEMIDSLFSLAKTTSREGTKGEQGTGFGMPLVKRFVEAYGGQLEVSSKEESESPQDHGTVFTLKLRPGVN